MNCRIPILLATVLALPALGQEKQDLLLQSYLKYSVIQQVQSQVEAMLSNAPAEDARQVNQSVKQWNSGRMTALRSDLSTALGQEAQSAFEKFVNDYSAAEGKADPVYLQVLVQSAGISPTPASYPELRTWALDNWLKPDVESAAEYLSLVEGWVQCGRQGKPRPLLTAWIAEKRALTAQAAAVKPKARNPLADAEAPLPEYAPSEESSGGPLDNFSKMREERRAKVLEESQSGMQQVATERDAAEQEYASKKTAAATAEAENMKQHADLLAATEARALEQRQNSIQAKLKGVVADAVGATVGSFSSGVGTRAGQEAAKELFNDK